MEWVKLKVILKCDTISMSWLKNKLLRPNFICQCDTISKTCICNCVTRHNFIYLCILLKTATQFLPVPKNYADDAALFLPRNYAAFLKNSASLTKNFHHKKLCRLYIAAYIKSAASILHSQIFSDQHQRNEMTK